MYLHRVGQVSRERTVDALRRNAARVAPLWPLQNFVAVNPFMGFADEPFEQVAQRLRKTHGAELVMPTAFYLERIDDGTITHDDLAQALTIHSRRTTPEQFVETVASSSPPETFSTLTDTASELIGRDLTGYLVDHVSRWASAYWDAGEASWSSPFAELPLYQAWRAEAAIDRAPEAMGIRDFRRTVSSLPDNPIDAVQAVFEALGISRRYVDLYLQRLGGILSGWLSFAAREAWDARLHDQDESTAVEELLAVLLSWEFGVWKAFESDALASSWDASRQAMAAAAETSAIESDLHDRLVLHAAWELADERSMVAAFDVDRDLGAQTDAAQAEPPFAQVAFCIDVRSEVYRRHLEASDDGITTIGFAGFFGMPIRYRRLGSDEAVASCPALVNPTVVIDESCGDSTADADECRHRQEEASVSSLWKAFKGGAVSCFGFVSPLGLTRLPKLFGDAFGVSRPLDAPRPNSGVDISTIAPEDRADLGEAVLRGMSLTERFGRLVVLAGHGAQMVNNPHASGYDCGACGGRNGEPNARVAAAILNDPTVRAELAERGICVPEDTHFVAALHDTTTDEVRLFADDVPGDRADDLDRLRRSFAAAGRGARAERAPRLGIDSDVDRSVFARARDWAQVRPEWGLAGCTRFVVAPRSRTRELDLGGSAFLHDYYSRHDDGFGVLEAIMTAPMIVTSWINLQYYASTVDNVRFGAGNKTLHNVVGTIGVLEGNAGDLRSGLPWQAVHDGARFQHDPVRLNVVIDAPIEAMSEIIERHDSLQNLLDNGWLKLFALDGDGRVSHRYDGDLAWREIRDEAQLQERATA